MTCIKPKKDIKFILERIKDVTKMYNLLVDEFALATIEKKLNNDSKEIFQKRWEKIAMNWNHWHQVGNIPRKKLINPFSIKYLDLRKIYNKLKNIG